MVQSTPLQWSSFLPLTRLPHLASGWWTDNFEVMELSSQVVDPLAAVGWVWLSFGLMVWNDFPLTTLVKRTLFMAPSAPPLGKWCRGSSPTTQLAQGALLHPSRLLWPPPPEKTGGAVPGQILHTVKLGGIPNRLRMCLLIFLSIPSTVVIWTLCTVKTATSILAADHAGELCSRYTVHKEVLPLSFSSHYF